MATSLKQGFDGQVDGTAVTTTNSGASGDAFGAVNLSGATLAYSLTQRAHGNRSMKISGTDVTGTAGYAAWVSLANLTTVTQRSYLYLTGLPSAQLGVVALSMGGPTVRAVGVTPTGQVGISDINGVSYNTTHVLSLNTWYRVESTINIGASVSAKLSLFLLDSTTAIETINPSALNFGTAPVTQVRIGKQSSTGTILPFYVDDIAVTDSATPIGPYLATAPTVTAGSNVSGTSVSLTSTATTFDGLPPTYAWTQTVGTTVTLAPSTTDPNPTFTAPGSGTYSFRVTVTDSVGATASATTTATVATVAGTPTATVAMYHDIFAIDASNSTGAIGGALTYTISPSTGLTNLAPGIWVGTMPVAATPYTVTVTEAGNATPSTATVTVPAATATTSGSGIHILMATADQSLGGTFT